ncbi:MAG: Hsp20/alpha crystallin family protein [Deltaproteobacteria bacterium]|nr:Hsp20/alpha crystallin family protein [Deltaproteobacteria bacterium]
MLVRRISNWPNFRSSYDELDRMRWEMDKLFEGLTRGFYKESGAGVFPLVNMTESKDSFIVQAETPGIKSDDIDISVTHDSISISGERKIPAEKEEAKYHRREREAGKFSRIVSLPGQVDTDKAEATCVDGILTVILPKAEVSKPKQITVK